MLGRRVGGDLGLGSSMTVETELHRERPLLVYERHAFDVAVTARASDAGRDVHGMIEVHEVRHVVHSVPANGFSAEVARAHGRELWAVRPDLRMTTHADLGARHTSVRRAFGFAVAIEADDTVVLYVMTMIELYGLFDDELAVLIVRRSDVEHESDRGQRGPRSEDDEPSAQCKVTPGGKQSGHRSATRRSSTEMLAFERSAKVYAGKREVPTRAACKCYACASAPHGCDTTTARLPASLECGESSLCGVASLEVDADAQRKLARLRCSKIKQSDIELAPNG